VTEIQLGQHAYTTAEALEIMNEPINNNGLVDLAQQLIATKLNIACNHADDSCIAQTIIDADNMIGDLVVPPIGDGFLTEEAVSGLVAALTAYNKGNLCAPVCSGTPTPSPCQLDKPALACSASAASNISLDVTGGPSGGPAGFVVQWMTLADFVANGNQWPDDPDELCEAIFSDVLPPNQTLRVTIGDDRLFDSLGVQSDCPGDPLLCDTDYVFRCRVNQSDDCETSPWSNTAVCDTLPCNPGSNCTDSQGYWRTYANVWPLQNLMLGGVSYEGTQLLQIMNRRAQGNGLIILAHQLIAAKLNMATGADPAGVQQAINDADNLIGGLVVPPIGNGYLSPAQTSRLTETLREYNEGTIGPGHCQE